MNEQFPSFTPLNSILISTASEPNVFSSSHGLIPSPQPSQPLSNHTHHFTVSRFYDFANSQKTSKLPINSPIKAYTSLSPAYYKPTISLFIAISLFPPEISVK
ncbi:MULTISPECIES: hypothetical protein [unclassified Bartonella]|uniref:hypothetical protein n=1 Tax=unclassified Bartonella TaxID=2645622 RepID=UPI0035CFBFA6